MSPTDVARLSSDHGQRRLSLATAAAIAVWLVASAVPFGSVARAAGAPHRPSPAVGALLQILPGSLHIPALGPVVPGLPALPAPPRPTAAATASGPPAATAPPSSEVHPALALRPLAQASQPTAAAAPAPPFRQCPPVGAAPSCAVLVVVNADRSVSVFGDSSVGPYDGGDDSLIGIQNNSSAAVPAITVSGTSGSGIFGFDGDGLCTYVSIGVPCGPTGYEGRGTTFVADPASRDDGEVDFAQAGLAPGAVAYFSLEGVVTAASLKVRQGHLAICPAVQLIGVRGSGEARGTMGTPVQAFSNALESQVTNHRDGYGRRNVYQSSPFDSPGYTAPPVDLFPGFHLINAARALMGDPNGQYYKSIVAGTADLRYQLATAISAVETGPCDLVTQFVLAGYSAGAQVVGNVLAGGIPKDWSDRIDAVVLFGDPLFNPSDQAVTLRSSFDTARSGILGRRPSVAFASYPTTALRGHIFSFCHRDDIICQGVEPSSLASSAHTTYAQADATWAANLAANALFGRPTAKIIPVITATRAGSNVTVTCTIPQAGTCFLHVTSFPDPTGLTGSTRDVVSQSPTGKMSALFSVAPFAFPFAPIAFETAAIASAQGFQEGRSSLSFSLK